MQISRFSFTTPLAVNLSGSSIFQAHTPNTISAIRPELTFSSICLCSTSISITYTQALYNFVLPHSHYSSDIQKNRYTIFTSKICALIELLAISPVWLSDGQSFSSEVYFDIFAQINYFVFDRFSYFCTFNKFPHHSVQYSLSFQYVAR